MPGLSKRKNGRPTSYKAEYAELCEGLALLGHTDKEMSSVIGVSESTFNLWKLKQPGFSESLKNGREIADTKVSRSLYQRACGYSHKAVKIFCNAEGMVSEVPYIERFPPDPTSCIFWLKNRQRGKWRDKQEVEHAGAVTVAGLDELILDRARKCARDGAKTKKP